MKRSLLVCVAALAATGCLSRSDTDCTDDLTCGSHPDASSDTGSAGSGGGQPENDAGMAGTPSDSGHVDAGSDVGTPDNSTPCDDNATPVQASCVIRSERGVFVSPTGDDGASGAVETPMKTIQAALVKAKAS